MPPGYQDRIDRVIAHIRQHLAGDLSPDALAEVAALSRFHFHRSFTAVTGETVAEAVRRPRGAGDRGLLAAAVKAWGGPRRPPRFRYLAARSSGTASSTNSLSAALSSARPLE